MKKIIQLVISLTAIAAICAAVLATVNAVTKDQIASIKEKAIQNAARLVMSKQVVNVEAIDDTTFVGLSKSGRKIAYAVIGVSSKGYGGDIKLMVGFSPAYEIKSFEKLEASETPGLGSNLTQPSFTKQFKGMDAKEDIAVTKDGGNVEAITSATITSRAVCEAINLARQHLQAVRNKK